MSREAGRTIDLKNIEHKNEASGESEFEAIRPPRPSDLII